jgi:hypothetical protein
MPRVLVAVMLVGAGLAASCRDGGAGGGEGDAGAPVVIVHPTDVTALVGGTAAFQVVATGTELAYQWFRDGQPIAGATSPVLLVTNVNLADGGARFHAVVSNARGSATSSSGLLTVVLAAIPPAIVQHPLDVTALVGGTAVFQVVATGTELAYQWFRDDQPIAGATEPHLQVANLTLADGGARFHAVVSNARGSATSSPGLLTVVAAAVPPTIVRHPLDVTVTEGNPAGFHVVAQGTGLRYQWRRNGADVAGATGPALTLAASLADDGAQIDVRVSDGSTSVSSRPALLRVNPITPVTEVTAHPRLWIRAADVSRLRSWAVPSNPVYRDGLLALAERARARMDDGSVPGADDGGITWSPVFTETYAALFALMSLVDPDPTARQDWASRARTLLMTIIDAAALGVGPGKWRGDGFSAYDRGRWVGESFGLTVDWIYPTLSAADKRTIRRVFLRWAAENRDGYPTVLTNHSHPELVPSGADRRNDPSLLDLQDPKRRALRYGANNYFLAHARNMFLMAAAFDAADDVPDPLVPGDGAGALRDWAEEAIGTYLYVTDHLFRNDASGGISPEGQEYGCSLGFYLGFMLAMHTSGWDDTARFGDKVSLRNHPFFADMMPALLASHTPVEVATTYGLVHQLPWFGDGEQLYHQDPMSQLGPLALYDQLVGNADRLAAIRWWEVNVPPGGAAALLDRASMEDDGIIRSLLYFLVFDPAQPGNPASGPALDPRPAEPLFFMSPGLGRILARTGWDAGARLLTYTLSWNGIDHQHGDGNMFDFYRKGEWLTKERTAYGKGAALSEFKNTLTVMNAGTVDPYFAPALERGSQFILGANDGDPTLLAVSDAPDYLHVTGDATPLYNYRDGSATAGGVAHVSRSLVWLKPDVLVVLDRAGTSAAGRFKRFWLNLPGAPGAEPILTGNEVRAVTRGGQQLFVTTVRPTGAGATLSVVDTTGEVADDWLAALDPMAVDPPTGAGARMLRVEAAGDPPEATFLHAIEGADAGASPSAVAAVESAEGIPYLGAVVGDRAVLFPVSLGVPFTRTRFVVPAGTAQVLVTGLVAGASYSATSTTGASGRDVTVEAGGALRADGGGVLVVP